MQNKKLLTVLTLCTMLSFALGYSINFYQHGRLTVTANVYIFRETPQGEELLIGNTLVDLLEIDVRNIIGFANGSSTAYKYMRLAN